MKKVLSALLIIAALFSLSAFSAYAEDRFQKGVAAEDLTVYSDPMDSGEAVITLSADDEVVIRGEEGEYLYVEVSGGDEKLYGYCPASGIKRLYHGVTNSEVNIRSVNNTTGELLGTFFASTELVVYGEAIDGWYEVEGVCKAGTTVRGYCFGRYINVTGSVYADSEESDDTTEDFNKGKDNAAKLTSNPINNTLTGLYDQRWYRISTDEEMDTVVIINSINSNDCIWNYELYSSHGNKEAGGVTGENGKGRLWFCNLDGTYYLKLSIAVDEKGNFASIIDYDVSAVDEEDCRDNEDDDGYYVIEKADTPLFMADDHIVLKANDGKAVLGCGIDNDGGRYYVLVGETAESVEISLCPERFSTAFSTEQISYNGKDCYYIVMHYDYGRGCYYQCNGGKDTTFAEDDAYELLNLYYGERASKGRYNIIRRFQKGDIMRVVIALAIGIVTIVAMVFVVVKFIKKMRFDRRYHY